jgi:hypothetical protein
MIQRLLSNVIDLVCQRRGFIKVWMAVGHECFSLSRYFLKVSAEIRVIVLPCIAYIKPGAIGQKIVKDGKQLMVLAAKLFPAAHATAISNNTMRLP